MSNFFLRLFFINSATTTTTTAATATTITAATTPPLPCTLRHRANAGFCHFRDSGERRAGSTLFDAKVAEIDRASCPVATRADLYRNVSSRWWQ